MAKSKGDGGGSKIKLWKNKPIAVWYSRNANCHFFSSGLQCHSSLPHDHVIPRIEGGPISSGSSHQSYVLVPPHVCWMSMFVVTLEACGDFILCVLMMSNLTSLWSSVSKTQDTSLSPTSTATERKFLHCSLRMLLHYGNSLFRIKTHIQREIRGDGCNLAAGSCHHAELGVLPLTWYERWDVQCRCIFPPGFLLL